MTSGLLRLLNDDELAAALAHETGHMIADGHVQAQFGLAGCRQNPDAESTADAIGVQLLVASGLPRNAMIRMLTKVRDAQDLGCPCRTALSARIDRLRVAMPTVAEQAASGQ